ncbi:MAG: CorA family divalent cation transporter [Phycisphaerales bacterium]
MSVQTDGSASGWSGAARVRAFGMGLRAGGERFSFDALPLGAVDGDGGGAGAAVLRWHHLDRLDPATFSAIWDDPEITAHATEAMLAEDTRPRVLSTPTGTVVILRGANLNPGADASDMLALRMWVGAGRVVSVSSYQLRAVGDAGEAFGDEESGPTTPMGLVVHLAERLTARMEPALERIEEVLAEIEDAVIDGRVSGGEREMLGRLRREASNFRRFLEPQCAALEALSRVQAAQMLDSHRERCVELSQQVRRDVEDLDACRERALVAQDQIASRLAETLNQRMYVLSVVAVIILPLSLITGILGINVGGIPGAETPWGFVWVMVILVVLGLGMAALLWWKRWI